MYVQWYPGHMTKAVRMMREAVAHVDCIIYVLDARAVTSCINPQFDEVIGRKPVLYVFNKSDLVDGAQIKEWERRFAGEGKSAVCADSVGGAQRGIVISKLAALNAAVIKKFADKGAKKTVRAMVIGVPNSGKSTLINSLCRVKRAATGNRPGVTRGKQWVSIGENIELLDTPGTLPPAFDDEQKALRLAFIGCIKEDVLDIEELAFEIISYFKSLGDTAFLARYKLDGYEGDVREILDALALSRGFIVGGGVVDRERAARAVAVDMRNQAFGKRMFDLP